MTHTIRDKEKLIARIRRLKGQIEGIERALVSEKPCGEILRQLASARGAMGGLTAEIMESHLREHVLHADNASARQRGAEEMLDIIRTYMK